MSRAKCNNSVETKFNLFCQVPENLPELALLQNHRYLNDKSMTTLGLEPHRTRGTSYS